MSTITFAMRHPVTTCMLVVALIGGGLLSFERLRIDIFPPINLPQIYIVVQFGGMSPSQMEGLIVNQFELEMQYVDGIREIESKSIQQIATIKLAFFSDTDMAKAMASVVSTVSRAAAKMPPNVLPPLVIQMDAGSVPVGYLVLESKTHSAGELGDLVETRVRPLVQKFVPGTIATAPFGVNVRAIVVSIDPDRLRAYDLTPDDVVHAISQGNTVAPAGNLYVRDQMPLVPSNAMIVDIQQFGEIPVKPGRNLYIRDIGTIADATDINYGYALVNGKKSVYLPIIKKNTASTLEVVKEIHETIDKFKELLPAGVDVTFAFDESPTVRTAIHDVGTEGAIGAVLTGLMILLFLRDWRSVLVVVFNIPLSVLGSMLGLWITGATINIMTLGGMALSIGILVDMSTVLIENIHVQMGQTPSLARAVAKASGEVAVPLLLILLCILSVFIPAFIMAEPVRSLFVPLALAVGFAVTTAYILSSTFVPVISVWLLKPRDDQGQTSDNAQKEAQSEGRIRRWLRPVGALAGRIGAGVGAMFHWITHAGPIGYVRNAFARRFGAEDQADQEHPQGFFDRVRTVYNRWLQRLVTHRRITVIGYFVACALVLALASWQLGTDLFPSIDSGEFILRFRAPPGTNFELTRRIADKALEVIRSEAGDHNVKISMGFAGQQAPNYALNNLVLFTAGPDDGQLRVKLTEKSGLKLASFSDRLRKELPKQVVPWLAQTLRKEGLDADTARQRAAQVIFGFEPGDIVSEVMSFGSPTPIEIAVISPDLAKAREFADVVLHEMRQIPDLRDVRFHQSLTYPTIPIDIDRQRAGFSGLTTKDVVESVLVTTSSSRYVARNYWIASNGVDYQVQVEVPTPRMNSPAQVATIPLRTAQQGQNLMVRDVALVTTGTTPGQIDRVTMQRYVSIIANVQGEDLGRAAKQVDAALQRAGKPPKGVRVHVKGQIPQMRTMFTTLAVGLAIAVVVIVLMLTAYFESLRLALSSIVSVPGVLCGVAIILLATHTTLNIESFMGAIMCIGVSVSNSVMLAAFIGRDWQEGRSPEEAAKKAGGERLRAILMTACAMTIGMVPMALALERGSEMQAPLGRAVIGGLIMSTFVTLLIVPPFFVLITGSRSAKSLSLSPDDPKSNYYDQPQAEDHNQPQGAADKQSTKPQPDAGDRTLPVPQPPSE
ncbi:MAG TPA: efflux RND transporter permease subunit [Pirellulales bacterium]|nr:efflux RND transporter permease subunit [Pirellulales bacterium]